MSLPHRVLSLLFVFLSLCCLPVAAWGAQPLRIGYIPIADCLQLYVAVEQGFFAAEGLNVETRPMPRFLPFPANAGCRTYIHPDG